MILAAVLAGCGGTKLTNASTCPQWQKAGKDAQVAYVQKRGLPASARSAIEGDCTSGAEQQGIAKFRLRDLPRHGLPVTVENGTGTSSSG